MMDRATTVILSMLFLLPLSAGAVCGPEDYVYKYTECDKTGGRWRVSVPVADSSKSACTPGAYKPPEPTRGLNCSFTCGVGQFLDINSQDCKPCPPGTYSTGGAVRFDDFSSLPPDFVVVNEVIGPYAAESDDTSAERTGASSNCSSGGWKTRPDGLLTFLPTPCFSVLILNVHLVQPGTLSFVYLFPDSPDMYFSVEVQNEQCMARDKDFPSKFPTATREGKWKTQKIRLDTGRSVITWKAMILHGAGSPLIIRQVDVSGLAFSGYCAPCPKGTYSSSTSSSSCLPCLAGTYAPTKGATSCQLCDPQMEFSVPRAVSCQKRQFCTANDYQESYSQCDANGTTNISYRWVHPKICRDEGGGVTLPSGQSKIPCPNCYPGSGLVNGTCSFCPSDYYSDGSSNTCKKCPAQTAPDYGYYFNRWYYIPDKMEATCQAIDDLNVDACKDVDTWLPSGDRIRTARLRRRDVYLWLWLDVPRGFRDTLISSNVVRWSMENLNPISRLTFSFETQCDADCDFYFFEQLSATADPTSVGQWNGTVKHSTFSYVITSETAKFGWIFAPYGGEKDQASIFAVTLENVVGGGAASCRPCPIVAGHQSESCVSCPPGHYMEEKSRHCLQCPENTFLNVSKRVGAEACQACGLNLQSADGVECGIGDCHFNISDRIYDLSHLRGFYQTKGVSMFGRDGNRYLHVFNISVCTQGEKATCENNYIDGRQDSAGSVSGQICRSTAYPREKNLFYAYSLVIAEQLVGVTDDPFAVVEGINISSLPIGDWKWHRLFFVYRFGGVEGFGSVTSKNCPNGHGALLVFRCDMGGSGGDPSTHATMSIPPSCPDGTCDGCLYMFFLNSPYACPRCRRSDYKQIVGECRHGQQTIHYIPDTKDCISDAAYEQQLNEQVPCSTLSFEIRLVIACSVILCFILIIMVVYVCRKNRGLEYKYMKLVESSGYGKEGELPTVESCGLQEDEDEEQSPEGNVSSSNSERVVFAKGGWFGKKNKLSGNRILRLRDHKHGDEDAEALAPRDDFDDA